jgi:hypothetical protein
MSAALHLSTLAVRQLVGGACAACDDPEGGEAVVAFLRERFSNHGPHLGNALAVASLKAWKAVELALASEELRQRWRALPEHHEDQALAGQVGAFFAAFALPGLPEGEPAFRVQCLHDLHGARAAGLLAGGKLKPRVLAAEAAEFARFTDPDRIVEADWRLVRRIADELREAGHVHLGRLLALQPAQGESLLALAVRYFFRRAVEGDAELLEALAFGRLETLGQEQEEALASLADALEQPGDTLDQVLKDVRAGEQPCEAGLGVKAEGEGPSAPSPHLDRDVLALLDEPTAAEEEPAAPTGSTDGRLSPADDLREWKLAQMEDTAPAYEGYLRVTKGAGRHAEEARKLSQQRKRQQEERQWKLATQKSTVESYEAYLTHYPTGQHAEEARQWLAPALRELLMEDMANVTLRRRYLALRTPEQRELDESRPQIDPGEIAGTLLVGAVLGVILGAVLAWLFSLLAAWEKYSVGPWLIAGAVLGVVASIVFEVSATDAAARRRALHAEMGPLPDGKYRSADEARREFLGE